MAKKFRVRVMYTTFIDKVVEADNESAATERAWCITGDTNAYQNNLDNAITEVELADDSEELTEITQDDQKWIDQLSDRRSDNMQGGTSDVK